MTFHRARVSLLDLVVAFVAIAIVAVPFLPSSAAMTRRPVVGGSMSVDQQVSQAGMISYPINPSLRVADRGASAGSVQWETYSTSGAGLKILLSSTHQPALRDSSGSVEVPDYATAPQTWDVDGAERRFGFTVQGEDAMATYAEGARWRGFEGRRSIEAARRVRGPVPSTRTNVRLIADMGEGMPSTATPRATVVATAVLNL